MISNKAQRTRPPGPTCDLFSKPQRPEETQGGYKSLGHQSGKTSSEVTKRENPRRRAKFPRDLHRYANLSFQQEGKEKHVRSQITQYSLITYTKRYHRLLTTLLNTTLFSGLWDPSLLHHLSPIPKLSQIGLPLHPNKLTSQNTQNTQPPLPHPT